MFLSGSKLKKQLFNNILKNASLSLAAELTENPKQHLITIH